MQMMATMQSMPSSEQQAHEGAVTDGSHESSHSTAGFCVHRDGPKEQKEGRNRAPGHPDNQSVYRNELTEW